MLWSSGIQRPKRIVTIRWRAFRYVVIRWSPWRGANVFRCRLFTQERSRSKSYDARTIVFHAIECPNDIAVHSSHRVAWLHEPKSGHAHGPCKRCGARAFQSNQGPEKPACTGPCKAAPQNWPGNLRHRIDCREVLATADGGIPFFQS